MEDRFLYLLWSCDGDTHCRQLASHHYASQVDLSRGSAEGMAKIPLHAEGALPAGSADTFAVAWFQEAWALKVLR